MLVSVLRRSSAWIVAGGLLVGCATLSPTADWQPLRGQDSAQRERDYASCVSEPWSGAGRAAGILMLLVFPAGVGVVADVQTTHCMERAGYEWIARSASE